MSIIVFLVYAAMMACIFWLNAKVFVDSQAGSAIAGVVELLLAGIVWLIFIDFEKKNSFFFSGGSVGKFSTADVILGIIIAGLLFVDFIIGFVINTQRAASWFLGLVTFVGMAYVYLSFLFGLLELFVFNGLLYHKVPFFENCLQMVEKPLKTFSDGNTVLFNVLMASTILIPYIIAFIVWITDGGIKAKLEYEDEDIDHSSAYYFSKALLLVPILLFRIVAGIVKLFMFLFGIIIVRVRD